MPRTSTTSVSVDGASPSNLFRAGSASHSSARISAYSADLVGKCLNSNPSEIEAAAATLFVVVPAKPLRAKQRFAALRISSRRKSLVIRSVLIVVSKHSLGGNVKRFAAVRERRVPDAVRHSYAALRPGPIQAPVFATVPVQ